MSAPSTPAQAMHPWLLTFRDPVLEASYDKYAFLRTNRIGDLRFFLVSPVVVFAIGVKTVVDSASFLPGLPHISCALALVLMWVAHVRSPPELVVYLRTYMSIVFRYSIAFRKDCSSHSYAPRIWIAIAGAVEAYYSSWMFALVPQVWFVVLQFLMATETFGNFPYAFGITLKFQQHLPTQLCAYLIFLFGKGRVSCEKMDASDGMAVLKALESYVDEFFEFCTSFVSSTMGVYNATAAPKMPCIHSTTFLMTYFSIGVVSYMLWNNERRSRTEFLKSINAPSASSSSSSSYEPMESKNDAQSCDLSVCLTLTTTAAVFWTCSTPLSNYLMTV